MYHDQVTSVEQRSVIGLYFPHTQKKHLIGHQENVNISHNSVCFGFHVYVL